MNRLVLVAVVFCGAASSSLGGIMHPSSVTPGQDYLDYGSQFSAVAGLFGHTNAGGLDWLGSATVIDQNWVMAGAHNTHVGSYDFYSIRTGTSLYSNLAEGIFYSSSFAVQDPSYTQIGQGRDIALIRFDTPITGVTPASLYTGPITLGTTVSIAGFGVSGIVDGTTFLDYSKRGFENVLDNTGSPLWTPDYIGYTFEGPGATNFLPLGGLTRPGDSGGGWYIDDGGQLKLAGITSASLHGIDSYGSESYASKIDVDWVNSYVGQTSSVPEPGSFLLLTMGFGILGVTKRFRRNKTQPINNAKS